MYSDSCFICATPFHIMTAVNLVFSRGLDADLYLLNRFPGSKEVASLLEEQHIFRNVIWCDDSELVKKYLKGGNPYITKIKEVSSYCFADRISRQILKSWDYTAVFIPWKYILYRLICYPIIKRKKTIDVFYYDEGVASYAAPYMLSTSVVEKGLAHLFFGKPMGACIHKIFLYSPDLYRSLNPEAKWISVCKIDIPQHKDYTKILNLIFRSSANTDMNAPVLILETLRIDLDFSAEENSLLDRAYQMVFHRFGKENVLVKRHPRDGSALHPDIHYYPNSSVPIELICANNDMSEKVIVCFSSTAAATPKLLFDQEPYVILLYKLVNEERIKTQEASYYTACQQLYRQNNRFFIPENEAQFSEALLTIQNQIEAGRRE